MTDTPGHVAVAPDSTGKLIDAQQLVTPEDGTSTVFRQTVTLGDAQSYDNLAAVDVQGNLYVRAEGLMDLFGELLAEVRLLRLVVEDMADTNISHDEALEE